MVELAGPYIHIYRPQPDVFPGPNSDSFVAGQRYADWVPNDHCFVQGPNGAWHAFGITHPAPPAEACIHEAEWLAFHAAAPPGTFREHLQDGAWQDMPKVLSPADRPGELPALYAPFIVAHNGLFHMVYGPDPIRLATSSDLTTWRPQGALFSEEPSARDPCVLRHDGAYLMVLCSQQSIVARTSPDLRTWSDASVELFRMQRPGAPESPFLVERDGTFFLFWCIYDGTHGPYDHRTFVYASDDPLDFHESELVAQLDAHAPELIRDEHGNWFISSVEWPRRGVSIAPLAWD